MYTFANADPVFGRPQKKSWVMSVALQSGLVALAVTATSTTVVPHHAPQAFVLIAPALSPFETHNAVPKPGHRAGGGGDHSPLPPSKGALAKTSLRPFTPPSAVVKNENPILAMEPAIAGPPDLVLPQVNLSQYGDPLARIRPASNGSGSGDGIGTGCCGGVGPGDGPSYGPGKDQPGGGIQIFRAGHGGVSAPALLYKVEPEYSEDARKAKFQGTVLLSILVDASGRAQDVRVARSLGLGLDEKAIEAVRKWKFKPGYKDGKPVTVAATVEVNFRLL